MFKIPKGYETIQKTFRLPVPLVEQLEALAFSHNISLNKLVIQCIQYALGQLSESESETE